MLEDLKKNIHQLSEKDAKTCLYLTLLRLNQLTKIDFPKEEILEEIQNIVETIDHQPPPRTDYNTIHIAGSESTAGSLRVGLEGNHKVIGFWEMFDIGPLWNPSARQEWLQDHINIFDELLEDEFSRKFKQATEELNQIPPHIPVVLWTADNAHEQIFHRYILHHLRNSENEVVLINATKVYQHLSFSNRFKPAYSGEIMPEMLKDIYEKERRNPLSSNARNRLSEEWLHLKQTKHLLRIWKNGEILGVREDYIDEELLYCAQKVQKDFSESEFVKAARIIGEIYGQLEGRFNTAFLEYRLRTLVYQGFFTLKGIPKSMRHYSVRVKNREGENA
ncbi:DUF1835 domain-containing protein [Sutcliffiella horikoshii]|uniref:DUF1835 domain-containing protein n=1 Tax=Sutcliffiella horikoshii TaxID=79883 RepID=A0A5D4SXV3_9BACI|nr:DUF1835 domain-containing protein [Sutcliffiella horikoshii]TYS67491.1 DUF1835 domain-containing protein [Sutcliffiella horikoshii]